MKKIGFIGCGNMGGTLASAAAKTQNQIFLADNDTEKITALAEQTNAQVSTNIQISQTCDIIFLGVKPQIMPVLAEEIMPVLKERKDDFCLVSMAAGITTERLATLFGSFPIIRIMPNTPAAVGQGMILYCTNQYVSAEQTIDFLNSMEFAGICDSTLESYIDAASAVSGCGPAFVYMFIEALADGGVKCGLTREKAIKYAAQTVLGAGKMVLDTSRHPGELKDAVCSPAGSTIEGVKALENNSFRSACIEAVDAAFKRTKELGK